MVLSLLLLALTPGARATDDPPCPDVEALREGEDRDAAIAAALACVADLEASGRPASAVLRARTLLGATYLDAGRTDEAEAEWRAVQRALRAATPPDPVALSNVGSNLGHVLINRGLFVEARAELESARDLRASVPDSDPLERASILHNLSYVLRRLSDLPAARAAAEEATRLFEEHAPRDPALPAVLANLSRLAAADDDYDRAMEVAQRALELRRELSGPDHPGVATSLTYVAELHKELGDFEKAAALYRQAVDIWEVAYDGEHPHLAMGLTAIASFERQLGRFDEAEAVLLRALAMKERLLGPDHVDVSEPLVKLAALARDSGDFLQARAYLDRALALHESVGEDTDDLARILRHVGSLAIEMGDLDLAESAVARSLAITTRIHGERSLRTSHAQVMQAEVLRHLDRDDEALALAREALALRLEVLGPDHPVVVEPTVNVGVMLSERGDHDDAVAHLEEALRITLAAHGPRARLLGPIEHHLSQAHLRAGQPAAAVEAAQASRAHATEAYGAGNPSTIEAVLDEARALAALGDLDGARALALQAHADTERLIHRSLEGLGQRAAMRLLLTSSRAIGVVLATADRSQQAVEVWDRVLQWKGIVRRALLSRGAGARATDDPRMAELREVSGRLSTLTLSGAGGEEVSSDTLEALIARKEILEREIGLPPPARIEPADVCQALGPGEALVDMMRYASLDGPRYMAFVVDARCAPRWVDLPGIELELEVRRWHELLATRALPSRIDASGAALTASLWAPLRSALAPGVSRVWMVPDGQLALVSFAALPTTDGRYLVEDLAFASLESAGDLLDRAERHGEGALVVGDVDYSGTVPEAGLVRSGCLDAGWAPLPGTAEEAATVARLWRKRRRRAPLTLLTGGAASEEAVEQAVTGPAVVHLATHGYAATSCGGGDVPSSLDPMLLSGLVLASGDNAAGGFLTAAEVAALDLSAAQLVVLSACDTGLGEVTAGEGVLGLRRAMAMAGAGDLVASLWPIDDAATADTMTTFYESWLRRRGGLDTIDALRAAQLAVLEHARQTGTPNPADFGALVLTGTGRMLR